MTMDWNYVADHWCERGHVVLVLEGELVTQFARLRPRAPHAVCESTEQLRVALVGPRERFVQSRQDRHLRQRPVGGLLCGLVHIRENRPDAVADRAPRRWRARVQPKDGAVVEGALDVKQRNLCRRSGECPS